MENCCTLSYVHTYYMSVSFLVSLFPVSPFTLMSHQYSTVHTEQEFLWNLFSNLTDIIKSHCYERDIWFSPSGRGSSHFSGLLTSCFAAFMCTIYCWESLHIVIGNMPQMRKITFDATICNVREYAWNEKDYFRSYNLQSQGSGSG